MISVYLLALYTLGLLTSALVEGNSMPQSFGTFTYLAKKVITKVVFDKQGIGL